MTARRRDPRLTSNPTRDHSERDGDDAPTEPAPACPGARPLPSLHSLTAAPISDDLYRAALGCARTLERALPSEDQGLECVPPPSAPLRIAPSFSAALLELDADRAETALEKVIARAPDLGEAHFRLGVLRLRRGDALLARRSFQSAAATLPESEDTEPAWASVLRRFLTELG